jgi:hypothetical protein
MWHLIEDPHYYTFKKSARGDRSKNLTRSFWRVFMRRRFQKVPIPSLEGVTISPWRLFYVRSLINGK